MIGTACSTCLTIQIFFLGFQQTVAFSPVYLCYSLNMSEYVSFLCFITCNLSIPVCSHRVSRATMDCHPKGLASLSWCARTNQVPICLLAHIHVCLTQFRLHPTVTSIEMETYIYMPTVVLRLRPFNSCLPPLSFLHVDQ